MINPEKTLSEYAIDIPAQSLRFLPEAFIVDGSGTDKTLSGRQKMNIRMVPIDEYE